MKNKDKALLSIEKAKEALEYGFHTKADQKKAYDHARKAYELASRDIQDRVLNLPKNEVNSHHEYIYWNIPEFHVYKKKHEEFIIQAFPDALDSMDIINQSTALRDAIKCLPIVAKKPMSDVQKKATEKLRVIIPDFNDDALVGIHDAMMEQLKTVLASVDRDTLEDFMQWALSRRKDVLDFKNDVESKGIDANSKETLRILYSKAGGQQWYLILSQKHENLLKAYIRKVHESTIEKRNSTISVKLIEAGASEITSSELARSSDGFNGTFSINTDSGKKTVHIQTIMAGGYNIQKLHYRVLTRLTEPAESEERSAGMSL